MRKLDFNDDWHVNRLTDTGEGVLVSLPHDAMRTERRTLKSRGRHNIGWFESRDYAYRKYFVMPEKYEGAEVLLEFEGVYHNAEVYVNGRQAAYRPYGYTNFFVNITKYLRWGLENEIRVIAKNADQPNSRWYSGSGIYRPVWLYVGKGNYILENGVKIRTVDCDTSKRAARIQVEVATSLPGKVEVEILDAKGQILRQEWTESVLQEENLRGEAFRAALSVDITDARLWNYDSPYLYACIARCGEDEVKEHFGIRTLAWDAENGLTINGKRVILKGACIHHDNGPLGACAYPEAEERKIRLLKEVGYNAIRSAHNPCSKALLDACDRLGMLVMDEYVDMWYIHKNEYDYASYMGDWWQQDLRDMVEKDYNHPSVILYSTGNEVAETGQKKGIDLTGRMTEYLHGLDETRPVTCGINIFFNLLYAYGFGVYSDDKAGKAAGGPEGKKKAVGSEFYNRLAGMLGDKVMKLGAALPMCDKKTKDAYAAMDVAGYNYGICRYRHDLKKYPKRLILGSETFCKDAYRFYELAKREPRIVGDFVWAGMDYMGEAGIGAWEYEDYAPVSSEDAGWLTAGSGRLDILGFERGEAAYTKVALEKERGPYLCVRPVYQKGRHTPSAWKMTDAVESWSWPGCEGKLAQVEVYARAAAAELVLNGKSVGQKAFRGDCLVTFCIPYEAGELTVIARDGKGRELGRRSLVSAGAETKLSLLPEEAALKAGMLGYIRIRYTDEKGIWKPMEKHSLKVAVENGELMGFGNACPYNPDGYWKDTAKTYYGEALTVARAKGGGSLRVIVTDENGTSSVEVPVLE